MKDLTELEVMNEEFLENKGISFVTVRMTRNILSHAIFDATRQMASYLKEQGIHDYSVQENGIDARVFVSTHLLLFNKELLLKSSIYKAGTRGDKRMWFGAEILPYTEDDNIYAIIAKDGELYIINESKVDIEFCFTTSENNYIKSFLGSFFE